MSTTSTKAARHGQPTTSPPPDQAKQREMTSQYFWNISTLYILYTQPRRGRRSKIFAEMELGTWLGDKCQEFLGASRPDADLGANDGAGVATGFSERNVTDYFIALAAAVNFAMKFSISVPLEVVSISEIRLCAFEYWKSAV